MWRLGVIKINMIFSSNSVPSGSGYFLVSQSVSVSVYVF